ncbi:tetratricopeptide repeat protein [Nocardia sp. NPDC050406]|uniref:tetratricopeptide repeat protein n=1 Tax=Nocardia sp. NPDC050406 TaxID=3364318 RepID=UPI0037B3049B
MSEFEPYEPGSMNDLGARLQKRGDDAGAETWYRRAAVMGHVAAMFNLGSLLAEDDRVDEAELWYRKAAVAGHADAMRGLSALLRERVGDSAEADYWSHEATQQSPTEPSDIRDEVSTARRVATRAGLVALTLLMLAAFGAILCGVIAVVIGTANWAREDTEAPAATTATCDGKPMKPDESCITFQNGKAFRETYQDRVEALERENEDGGGLGLVFGGGAMIVGGLAAIVVCRSLGPRIDADTPSPATEAPRPAPTAPPRPAPPAPHDYRALLALVAGNSSTAERLIDYERRAHPNADRATLIARAIDRLAWERQRHS